MTIWILVFGFLKCLRKRIKVLLLGNKLGRSFCSDSHPSANNQTAGCFIAKPAGDGKILVRVCVIICSRNFSQEYTWSCGIIEQPSLELEFRHG